MEILDQRTDTRVGSTAPGDSDDSEPKTTIRFQKGVDFETFDDFRELFLSILKSTHLAAGERRIAKLIESDTPGKLRSLPNFGAFVMTFPDSVLDLAKLRNRIRESERVMEEMGDSRLDPEDLITTMLQIGWPGGMLSLRCIGVPKISEEAEVEIRNTMQQFSSDCQMMLVWFAAILGSQSAMRSHLHNLADKDEPFTINTYRPDGRVDSVLAQIPVDSVLEAFSEAGEFERLYAKAFVIFTYQIWEEVARPAIAKALQVDKAEHVRADLMGEWRYLRNWLVHRHKEAERDYFNKAKTLSRILDIQPGDPSLTATGVATLMQHLNHMHVDVNPRSLEFGLQSIAADASMVAGLAKTVEAGHEKALPEALMYPSGVTIVFNDGPTATIHERDCRHADEDFRGLAGGRALVVTSRELARGALEHLGKTERKCGHCS